MTIVKAEKRKKNPAEKLVGKKKIRKESLVCPECGMEFEDVDEYADHRADEKRGQSKVDYVEEDEDMEKEAEDQYEEEEGEERGIKHKREGVKPEAEEEYTEDEESQLKRDKVSPEAKALQARVAKLEATSRKLAKVQFKKLEEDEEEFEDEELDEDIKERVDSLEDKVDKILSILQGGKPEEADDDEVILEEEKANYKNQGKSTKVLDRKEQLPQVVNPNDTLPEEGFANDAQRQKLYKKGETIVKGKNMNAVGVVNKMPSSVVGSSADSQSSAISVDEILKGVLTGRLKARDVFNGRFA